VKRGSRGGRVVFGAVVELWVVVGRIDPATKRGLSGGPVGTIFGGLAGTLTAANVESHRRVRAQIELDMAEPGRPPNEVRTRRCRWPARNKRRGSRDFFRECQTQDIGKSSSGRLLWSVKAIAVTPSFVQPRRWIIVSMAPSSSSTRARNEFGRSVVVEDASRHVLLINFGVRGGNRDAIEPVYPCQQPLNNPDEGFPAMLDRFPPPILWSLANPLETLGSTKRSSVLMKARFPSQKSWGNRERQRCRSFLSPSSPAPNR